MEKYETLRHICVHQNPAKKYVCPSAFIKLAKNMTNVEKITAKQGKRKLNKKTSHQIKSQPLHNETCENNTCTYKPKKTRIIRKNKNSQKRKGKAAKSCLVELVSFFAVLT